MTDTPSTPLTPTPAAPEFDELFFERDDALLHVRLDHELDTIRSIEPRADQKAGHLLNLAYALLVAALTLLGAGKLTGPAAVAAAVAAGLVGIAVLLLTAALRPRLDGDFGFPRWARARTDREVMTLLTEENPAWNSPAENIRQLRWLSRALYAKFTRMRAAQTLLVAAMVVGAVAAILSAIGR